MVKEAFSNIRRMISRYSRQVVMSTIVASSPYDLNGRVAEAVDTILAAREVPAFTNLTKFSRHLKLKYGDTEWASACRYDERPPAWKIFHLHHAVIRCLAEASGFVSSLSTCCQYRRLYVGEPGPYRRRSSLLTILRTLIFRILEEIGACRKVKARSSIDIWKKYRASCWY